MPALVAGQCDQYVPFSVHVDSVRASAVSKPAWAEHAAEEVFYALDRAAVGFRAACVNLADQHGHSSSSGGPAHCNWYAHVVCHLVEPSPAALELDLGHPASP
jgi:hypothetical protein